ncbi:hypothetical protein DF185_19120 [Marinifilum breve]|uniref:Uncharacterized protein n=1 Tax=Marinifilum breve TaxID=2184082 RepID=A0A2V3ZSG1_9BACT|nr:hypothetical protein DF185_19120 [Marinifilum breve]
MLGLAYRKLVLLTSMVVLLIGMDGLLFSKVGLFIRKPSIFNHKAILLTIMNFSTIHNNKNTILSVIFKTHIKCNTVIS